MTDVDVPAVSATESWKWSPHDFVHHEALLLDERSLDAWLDLYTADAMYWIPGESGADADPMAEISIIYDDDTARRLRVERLQSGRQFAQEPISRTCHILSRVEVGDSPDDACVSVAYNVVVYESRVAKLTVFPGRCTMVLRRTDDGLRVAEKKIVLINRDHYIDNLTFLL